LLFSIIRSDGPDVLDHRPTHDVRHDAFQSRTRPRCTAATKVGERGRALLLVALAAMAIAAAVDARAAGDERTSSCPIAASTDFAVYGQTGDGGVAASSRRWMAHFLDWWNARSAASHHGPAKS
jgi:hypothetical protein